MSTPGRNSTLPDLTLLRWLRGGRGGRAGVPNYTQLHTLLLLGICSSPNRTQLSFEQHRSQYLAEPGTSRRSSHRKQSLSIWLNALSISMVRSSLVVAVVLKPSSDGLDNGLAAVCGLRTKPVKGGGVVSCAWTQWPARPSL